MRTRNIIGRSRTTPTEPAKHEIIYGGNGEILGLKPEPSNNDMIEGCLLSADTIFEYECKTASPSYYIIVEDTRSDLGHTIPVLNRFCVYKVDDVETGNEIYEFTQHRTLAEAFAKLAQMMREAGL